MPMNRFKHHISKQGPLTSLKELRAEKFRLQREIMQTEGEIKENYRHLVEALTFKNIIGTIVEEIAATNLLVSQAYSMVRPLFNRKKKKKRVEKPLEELEPKVDRRKTLKKNRTANDILILRGDDIRNEE
ncbi:MAG: hypothetical protein IH596_07405 [Bacteroidales bacterium]|nr:hypothetical protein [Bacteroidales bacterium]